MRIVHHENGKFCYQMVHRGGVTASWRQRRLLTPQNKFLFGDPEGRAPTVHLNILGVGPTNMVDRGLPGANTVRFGSSSRQRRERIRTDGTVFWLKEEKKLLLDKGVTVRMRFQDKIVNTKHEFYAIKKKILLPVLWNASKITQFFCSSFNSYFNCPSIPLS